MTDANSSSPLPGSGLVSDANLAITRGCEHVGHVDRSTCRDYFQAATKNSDGRPSFVLAESHDARYTSISKPAGPLPQGTLSLGGSFFLCGGRP